MPEKDELDRLLDSALATYADPGADSGLERRVLAALAVNRKGARWSRRWLAWAIAVPVAASLLIWVGMETIRQRPSIQNEPVRGSVRTQTAPTHAPAKELQTAQRNAAHPSGAKSHRDVAAVSRLKSCPDTESDSLARTGMESTSCAKTTAPDSAKTQVAEAPPLPKLDVFPTPQPLTPQERALAAVATQSPAPVRAALVEAQKRDDAPVRIAAIHIPPIELSSQTQP